MARRVLYRLRFALDPTYRIKVAIAILERRTFKQYPDPEWVEVMVWAYQILRQHKAQICSWALATKLEKYFQLGGLTVSRKQLAEAIDRGNLATLIASVQQ